MRFEEKAEEVLRGRGWYEGRKIDITEQLEMYKLFGYEIFDILPKFLEEFDKLKVCWYRDYVIDMDEGDRFDVLETFKLWRYCKTPEQRYKKSQERRLPGEEKNVPVGEIGWGDYIIYLLDTGVIGTTFGAFGQSIDSSINNMILEKGLLGWDKIERGKEIRQTIGEVRERGSEIKRNMDIKEYRAGMLKNSNQEDISIHYTLFDNGEIDSYYVYYGGKYKGAKKISLYESGMAKEWQFTSEKHKGYLDEMSWYENGFIKSTRRYDYITNKETGEHEKEDIRHQEFDERGIALIDERIPIVRK